MMRKLTVFNFMSLDGYYKGTGDDTNWHRHGEEESRYSEEAMEEGNILIFGRKTFEMMKSFWPTAEAKQLFPKVAEGMNGADKIVLSATLQETGWDKTTIMRGIDEIKQLKQTEGKNMAVLGSGSVVTQLAEAGLVDEYQFMIDPVVLGEGTSIFNGLKHILDLELIHSRVFNSGVVLLYYKPKQLS